MTVVVVVMRKHPWTGENDNNKHTTNGSEIPKCGSIYMVVPML